MIHNIAATAEKKLLNVSVRRNGGKKQVVDVVVINNKMKNSIMALLINIAAIAQVKDSTTTFKKSVRKY
jgi:hypothetical protein